MADEGESGIEAQDARLVRAILERQCPPEWGAQAFCGYAMRLHAEEDHPGDIEHIAELSTRELPAEKREAWLFGYRFEKQERP